MLDVNPLFFFARLLQQNHHYEFIEKIFAAASKHNYFDD